MKKSLIEKVIEKIESKKNNENSELLSSIIEDIKSKEENAEFEEVAKVLIKHLNNPYKYHPHHTVIVNSTEAELVEGVTKIGTEEYLVD